MIDYHSFHNYLKELIELGQRDAELRGMSALARKHHCTALTKAQFYKMRLDKMKPSQLTPQLSRVIRDAIGQSEALNIVRDTIGTLNDTYLDGGRISQGSDRNVQITVSQPMDDRKPVSRPAAAYRPGQILCDKSTGELLLVSKLLPGNRFTYRYITVDRQQIRETVERKSYAQGDGNIRLAKGNEVARFLGACTRGGYEWTVDNTRGLFEVKRKVADNRTEVFASDLPAGYEGIYALPAIASSPYRFALRCKGDVTNASDYMSIRRRKDINDAVQRQLDLIDGKESCEGISEHLEYDVPTLCCTEKMREYRIAFVRTESGTAYWLARDRDVLRLMAWISFTV